MTYNMCTVFHALTFYMVTFVYGSVNSTLVKYTVYLVNYAHNSCFLMFGNGLITIYVSISFRVTSLALGQSMIAPVPVE